MRYSDLIQFEPIESVIQLTEADDDNYANQLLSTYVISERMAEVLDELIIEHLQYDRPIDNKSLFIVGNYGTGKSHLMSVISTIAERPNTSDYLKNGRVARKAKEIEGKFKVIRVEVGAVQTPLREVLCNELEEKLDKMGVDYSFPPVDEVTNNKEALFAMMAAFQDVYPDHGLLLVVDELLDYLRGKKEQELYLDLGFLREVGETCSKTRFRFMAGIQEMLFDNPKFQFVADQIRRVKERFEQAQIVRDDVAYVVSERLLKKDDRQKALIREHLQKFSKVYHRLSEDIEQYVDLFPIHPEYLATFEKVTIAETRVILKTISNEMKKIMGKEVPANEPGIISYDSYWPYIEGDSSLKSNPDVKKVMAKVTILRDRINHAFTRPIYKPVALRIVHALAVFRLTTDDDIYAPIGLTAEEMRDGLFLYMDLLDDDDPADFLKTSIEAALREILKTVSYQYISTNETNGQYYLDIQKDIAVDDLIEQRAEALTDDQLDRHYFEALKLATEVTDDTFVTGYKIWPHEISWEKKKVMRQGYLFFGAPNERSTAQPPRDFYIYLLQPFAPPKFKDEVRADEVFFRLVDKEELFVRVLKLYAGAREMAATSASSTKKLYEEKANGYLKQLVSWIKEHFVHAFEVTYQGKRERVNEHGMFLPQSGTVKEMIDAVSANLLSQWFDEKYELYPTFSKLRQPLTRNNIETYVRDTFKQISGTHTKQGHAMLDGLVLLKGDTFDIRESGYAKWVLDQLADKAQGQVVNRSAFIETIYTVQGTEDVERTTQFQMEPELFAVLLAALVYNGDLVVTIDGKSYDAMKYEPFIRLPLNDIINFSHVKKPSGLPIRELTALFDLLGIGSALLKDHAQQSIGIRRMLTTARAETEKTAKMLHEVRKGFSFMHEEVLSGDERDTYVNQLTAFKSLLDGLEAYNTPAKLHNFRYSVEEIERQRDTLALLQRLQQLQSRLSEYTTTANYIDVARRQLPTDHQWSKQAEETLTELVSALKNGADGRQEVAALSQLKEAYIDMYMRWHGQARLNATDDSRKEQLLLDERVQALERLADSIDLLPKGQLTQWKNQLRQLTACWKLTKGELERYPTCQHCRFSPSERTLVGTEQLEELEDALAEMFSEWTATLQTNLNDPSVQNGIALLQTAAQEEIKTFIAQGELTLPLDSLFVKSVQEVLQGIDKVEIDMKQLIDMMGGGSPLTVAQVRARFERMLQQEVGSKSNANVRIMLRQGENTRDAVSIAATSVSSKGK